MIRAGEPVADRDVTITPRIGITQCADWPLRWFVTDNPLRVQDAASAFPRTSA